MSIPRGRLPYLTPTKTTSMASSLRRRLQVWYGLVLFGIVLVFGVLLYSQIRSMRLSGVDVELTALADYLDANLRGVPPIALANQNRLRRTLPSIPKPDCLAITSRRLRISKDAWPISIFRRLRVVPVPTSLPQRSAEEGLVFCDCEAGSNDLEVDAECPGHRRVVTRFRDSHSPSGLRDRGFCSTCTNERTASHLDPRW